MSDLDNFIKLYKSFGIDLKPKKTEKGEEVFVNGEYSVEPHIIIGMRQGDLFCGYSGFFSDVIFDKDGKFVEQGFWE